ncbi:P-loop containing nucleoside triphosphate hydrolase protein [Aspergillus bertholletiae]|uniref:P-loop containing nucleoside triphosphate hydrolase protein n=1 Tax=Aspergillus bertholletiae TaxID=1226010 RepID=A0A5N7B9P5_9EURO|nr:P-loop containing nucleoside triphosphate hydrolase protein [Aspergillus bertholletiae]
MPSPTTTDPCGDGSFGPFVTTLCRGGFDFTIRFEASILTIAPVRCFLLLTPFRIFHLSRQSHKIALVALVATQPATPGREPLAAAILELVAGLAVAILIDLEHVRFIRPSFLVSAYLFIMLLFDLVRVRTAWLLSDRYAHAACLSLSLTFKAKKVLSGESISGLFSRGLFAWLNDLLWKEYTMPLAGNSLPTIHEKLLSRDLSAQFAESWASSKPSRQNALLLVVVSCLRWERVRVTFPRSCVVGFSLAQPFLVGEVVTIRVCTACCQHLGYRVTAMLRGGLMALVYQHMMNLPSGSTEESSAVSLMGTDIEILAEYFQLTVCEIWANILQLGLATWLLQTQVGAVCIAPIVVVIIFTVASLGMGNDVSARQKSWLGATEKRINFTTILRSIQNIKFLGLTEIMGVMINALRVDELRISKKFRRIQTVRVSMVNLPTIVGQLAKFIGYAIVATVQGSGGLNVLQATTSPPLANLLVTPLSNPPPAIPDTFASIGCLNRIQDFLRQPTRPVGGVGSGKSTFLRGLASETPVLEGELFMRYPDLAFCEQASWLTNASIRENNIGESLLSVFDAEWYHTVVRACGLDPDLKRMPAGDETPVGSKGAKLSGGQKQRIAIARAVYSRKRIACFDDVLSGLDNATAHLAFNNIFVHHSPQADFIIVLGDNGQVIEQGSHAQLRSHTGGYIYRLGVQPQQIDGLAEPADTSNSQRQSQDITTGSLNASPTSDGRQQTNDLSVYKCYFSRLGGLHVCALLLFLVVNVGIDGFRSLAVIEAGALLFAVFRTWVVIVPAASKNLHSIVLRACMSAPLSSLSNTETGTLITCFSQDMRLADMILPRGFISTGFSALTVLLVGTALALHTHVDPGLLGVSLVMMIDLGHILSELIQNWTLLKTSLGAIARIKDFAENTPNEERFLTVQVKEPHPEWPQNGEILFADTSIAYCCAEGSKPVLDGIRLHIRAGEKIGLCGKSGSGKSSLALSLLRLNAILSGNILIGGEDISFISVLGTIRQNADPLNFLASQDIINALQRVGIWDAILAHHGGHDESVLDTNLNERVLSQGQKQLFCLARALLKKSKFLLLDEPTSSLDTDTDARVQKVIRESFSDCTVIIVARRIRTLLDFDRVAVLDSGRIVESGPPRELLIRPEGAFAKLLEPES